MTTVSSNPFKLKHYYQAKITEQQYVLTGKEEEAVHTLILKCRLQGELLDTYKPSKGTIACPEVDVEVMMRFNPDNPSAMEIVSQDLEKLGFDGDDLEQLNPENGKGKYVDFVGKTVYVTPKFGMKNDREVTYWNLRFPREFVNKKVAKGTITGSSAAEAYREAVQARKEKAGSGSPF